MTKLFVDLRVLLVSLIKKIIKPSYIKITQDGQFLSAEDFKFLMDALNDSRAYLLLDSVDFGASFTIHLGKMKLSNERIREIKQRCQNYLSVLCQQLVQRLPTNIHFFENLRYFTPEESLKPVNRIDYFKLPLALAGKN